MNRTSFPYPPEVDEFEKAGFTPIPSVKVAPPRVAESPAHLECRLIQIVKVGQGPLSGNLCICQVVCFHIAEGVCLPNGVADIDRIDLIGRLGGDGYSTVRDHFDLPVPRTP
jgi:flavin reductase (DIM6/NTAB) family NADH-FMN oxidoreductase RutF